MTSTCAAASLPRRRRAPGGLAATSAPRPRQGGAATTRERQGRRGRRGAAGRGAAKGKRARGRARAARCPPAGAPRRGAGEGDPRTAALVQAWEASAATLPSQGDDGGDAVHRGRAEDRAAQYKTHQRRRTRSPKRRVVRPLSKADTGPIEDRFAKLNWGEQQPDGSWRGGVSQLQFAGGREDWVGRGDAPADPDMRQQPEPPFEARWGGEGVEKARAAGKAQKLREARTGGGKAGQHFTQAQFGMLQQNVAASPALVSRKGLLEKARAEFVSKGGNLKRGLPQKDKMLIFMSNTSEYIGVANNAKQLAGRYAVDVRQVRGAGVRGRKLFEPIVSFNGYDGGVVMWIPKSEIDRFLPSDDFTAPLGVHHTLKDLGLE